MIDHAFLPHFQYRHRANPYHDKLGEFSDFVLRDHEAETFAGSWNTEVFQRSAPLAVEIGTGHGEFMQEFCQKYPHHNYVGIDYRFKRSFQVARKLDKDNKDKEKQDEINFRYLRAKGERLAMLFGPAEVDQLFYFFPDPWPKTRHHKKRLFQAPFLEAAHQVLAPNGKILIKTDHDGLFQWMLDHCQQSSLFTPDLISWNLHQEWPDHFMAQHRTKFEKIFLGQGIPIKAMTLLKSSKQE